MQAAGHRRCRCWAADGDVLRGDAESAPFVQAKGRQTGAFQSRQPVGADPDVAAGTVAQLAPLGQQGAAAGVQPHALAQHDRAFALVETAVNGGCRADADVATVQHRRSARTRHPGQPVHPGAGGAQGHAVGHRDPGVGGAAHQVAGVQSDAAARSDDVGVHPDALGTDVHLAARGRAQGRTDLGCLRGEHREFGHPALGQQIGVDRDRAPEGVGQFAAHGETGGQADRCAVDHHVLRQPVAHQALAACAQIDLRATRQPAAGLLALTGHRAAQHIGLQVVGAAAEHEQTARVLAVGVALHHTPCVGQLDGFASVPAAVVHREPADDGVVAGGGQRVGQVGELAPAAEHGGPGGVLLVGDAAAREVDAGAVFHDHRTGGIQHHPPAGGGALGYAALQPLGVGHQAVLGDQRVHAGPGTLQRLLHVDPGFLATQGAGLVDRRVLELVAAQLHLQRVARGRDLDAAQARHVDGGPRRQMHPGVAVRLPGGDGVHRRLPTQHHRGLFGGGQADLATGDPDGGAAGHVDLPTEDAHFRWRGLTGTQGAVGRGGGVGHLGQHLGQAASAHDHLAEPRRMRRAALADGRHIGILGHQVHRAVGQHRTGGAGNAVLVDRVAHHGDVAARG